MRGGDRMNGGRRITSGGRSKEERKTTFVKSCQILDPVRGGGCQHSCTKGDEGPAAPIFTDKYTQVNTLLLSLFSFCFSFFKPNEYFITSYINIHSNGFAHYRYSFYPSFYLFICFS